MHWLAAVAEPARGGQAGRFSRLWRPHMISLYVIKSINHKYRYVGITNKIEDRLRRHNSGRNLSTKRYAPFALILRESYKDYVEARDREKFLKSGVGRKYLDSLKLD